MRFLILLALLIPSLAFPVSNSTGILTQSALNATITSTKILSRNDLRTYLLIQNVGTDTIIVKFNSVQSGSEGIQIPAGGNYEPVLTPKDSVWIESASGSQAFMILEGQ